ncbi:right-handed parallel beta-helix repeat-containing protein [Sphingomonas glacialis]|uniref:right-handed parallel beta-helix repeat-containing protein n=1 Tax=Sphingomonas glacialis TaxID=658225 RepID=UPI00167B5A3C|nr:right-handed parallel beta-helix repeat-containing protein [Sphingomonas glacialis]
MYRLFPLSVMMISAASSGCYAKPIDPQSNNGVEESADPAGVRDSTKAFAGALKRSPSIKLPCGTYRMNLELTNANNISFEGSGSCTIFKPANPTLPVISITSTNFSEFKSFSIIGDLRGSASGIFVKSSGNTMFSKIMVSGFRGAGVQCVGGTGSSGIKVTESYLLDNVEAGISYENCQDFFIRENNIGKNNEFGILLKNSSAGQIVSNYIWENGVAISASGIYYDWFSKNRLTQSKREGFKCEDCAYINISDNQSYQNSTSGKGVYDEWKFRYSRNMIFSNNILYDWTATPHVRYGISIDKTSSKIIVDNNIFENQYIAPFLVDQSAEKITIKDNQ